MHNTLPQSFSDFCVKASEISGRTTRSSGNRQSLYIPRYNTNRLPRSIKYQPPILYFKKKYKTHLMHTYAEK